MTYNTKIIEDYIKLRDTIVKRFASGNLEYKFFAKETGFNNRITFTKRVKDNSFSAEELLAIVNIINNEDEKWKL